VFAFNEDSANNLWIGTTHGLIFKNRGTGASKKFVQTLNPMSLSSSNINSIYRDNEGILWIGTVSGLNRFNAATNNFTRYINDSKDSNTISAGGIFATEDEGDDSLLIGTENGLDLMNKRTGTFNHFKNNPKDSNSITSSFLVSLLRDKSGRLWIGSWAGGGLYYFNHTTRTFTHFLKGVTVSSLFQDSSGTVWVGTDNGLYKTDNPTDGFIKFSDPGSAIETSSIWAIQEDNKSNIWVSTASGIFKLNSRRNHSSLFSANYGVNAGSLNVLAGYKSLHGEIYFGSIHGYYVFSPDELVSNPIPPQIVFTNFLIGGKPVIPGKQSALTSEIESVKNISLSYDQNIFSVEFAGIHYSSPENNHHLYMLENYDQTWHEAGAEKTAFYFNVPPGKYIFHVKAASSDGIWAEKSIVIIISPPWWRTWWAYTLYGILLVASMYGVHRFQKQRVIRAERERARERELFQAKEIEKAYDKLKATQTQLIQSEKMASLGELTAGIAHEIQNPLNFVNNFSEVNSELIDELEQEADKGNVDEVKMLAKDIKENEQKIIHHGKRADAIVKGMLQHSRVSTGQKEPTDINALADEYLRLSYHGMRAKDKASMQL
jgi:streptogramin lyase